MINKFLPLVGITVILALFIVWKRVQTTKYSYEVVILQNDISDLEERNRRLESEISVLKKPERIVRAVKAIRPGLAPSLENRSMLAKTKKRLKPKKKGRPTNIVFASARKRRKSQSRETLKSQRNVRVKGRKR